MAAFSTFVGASYESQSPISDQEDLINWYVERMESEGATAPAALYPTPGVEARITVPAVGGRCLFSNGHAGHISGTLVERCFGVVGGKFYEFFSNNTAVERGDVAVDANPATISSNGDGGGELFITAGDHGYCYDLATDALTEVLTSGATQGGSLYGYFVAFDKTQSRIRISDLFDGQTWDPTQFAERTIGADPWQAMLVTPYGQICLPGTQTGEFWYNTGAFPFPFAPDPSGLFAQGINATFSIAQAGNSATWLSSNVNGGYQVQSANGYAPQRISTHPVETAIAQYVRVDDAVGQTYEADGHAFYLLTFPTQGVTWCFDYATKLWHKRGTWISEDSAYEYWRPVFHVFAFGKHLMADRETNVIYEMSNLFPLDVDERPIRRLRRSPAINADHVRLFFDRFELLLESGLGTSSGQGENPQVMLRLSNDGGRTFGNEISCSAGRTGAYEQRVIFWRLGMARNRVFEVTVSDPIPWRVTAAYLVVRKSAEAA